jgi:hypothetical protein
MDLEMLPGPPNPQPHFSDEDLKNYLAEQFDLERAAQFRTHVLNCPACENKLLNAVSLRLAATSDLQQPKRREPRVLKTGVGIVQSLSPLSFEKVHADIDDVSPLGYGLHIPVAMEPGGIIGLDVDGLLSIGTVRFCRPTGDGRFRLGIELQATPKRQNAKQ